MSLECGPAASISILTYRGKPTCSPMCVRLEGLGRSCREQKHACAHYCWLHRFLCGFRALDLSDNALGEKGVRACAAAIESQVRPEILS